jgi:hypothetical protein
MGGSHKLQEEVVVALLVAVTTQGSFQTDGAGARLTY